MNGSLGVPAADERWQHRTHPTFAPDLEVYIDNSSEHTTERNQTSPNAAAQVKASRPQDFPLTPQQSTTLELHRHNHRHAPHRKHARVRCEQNAKLTADKQTASWCYLDGVLRPSYKPETCHTDGHGRPSLPRRRPCTPPPVAIRYPCRRARIGASTSPRSATWSRGSVASRGFIHVTRCGRKQPNLPQQRKPFHQHDP